MKAYTVTVTPDDASEATATIRYELNGDTPRITDVHFAAGENQSLSTARLPQIDIAQLLAAVIPAVAATPAARPIHTTAATGPMLDITTVAADVDDAATASVAVPSPRVPHTAPVVEVEEPTSTPARRTRAPRTPAAKHTAATKTVPVRKAATPKAAPTKKTSPKKAPATVDRKASDPVAATDKRARRFMPDDFAEVYRQASTVAAVADFYGVPAHTAQGWVKTARKHGMIDPARSRN